MSYLWLIFQWVLWRMCLRVQYMLGCLNEVRSHHMCMELMPPTVRICQFVKCWWKFESLTTLFNFTNVTNSNQIRREITLWNNTFFNNKYFNIANRRYKNVGRELITCWIFLLVFLFCEWSCLSLKEWANWCFLSSLCSWVSVLRKLWEC